MFNLSKKIRAFTQKSFIGMDIDGAYVKLVEISQKNGKFQLENYVSYASSSEWIKEFSSNLFFKSKQIVIGISDTQILAKKFILSKKLSKKEKKEYLFLEMEKVALCSTNELYIDFQAERTDSHEKNTMEYLCAAVRRQTIDALTVLFQETPFQIKKIGLISHIKAENSSAQSILPMSLNPHLNKVEWEREASFFMNACLVAMNFPYANKTLNFLPKPKKTWKKPIILLFSFLLTSIFSYFLMPVFFLKNNRDTTIKPTISIISPTVKKTTKKEAYHPLHYSLKDTPIHFFKMMGFINAADNSEKIWGIIKTPDGKIYHVTVNRVIGKEQAKIIEILDKKIILIQQNRKYYIE